MHASYSFGTKPIDLVQTALQLCGIFANVHAESAHVLRSSSKFAQLQAVLTSAGVCDPDVNILQIAVYLANDAAACCVIQCQHSDSSGCFAMILQSKS